MSFDSLELDFSSTLRISNQPLAISEEVWILGIPFVSQKLVTGGGWGSSPSNLFITLKVAEDPKFSRQGADIYVDNHISFTQKYCFHGRFCPQRAILRLLQIRLKASVLSSPFCNEIERRNAAARRFI